MAYVPNAIDETQPTDDVKASTAAAEFRALKARVNVLAATGGGGGGGASLQGSAILVNSNTLTTNVTIGAGTNGSTTGPLSIPSGLRITVATGSRLVVL